MDEVKKVCVVGAGTMGSRIALVSAAFGGYDVAVYDISEEALKRAQMWQRQEGGMLVAAGRLTQEKLAAGLNRITFTTDSTRAAENADILSESVAEQPEVKRGVHALFDRLLPPRAVMTTNSSTLLVSDIEDAVSRGDKFAALHFHGGMGTLVHIMRGPRTSDETVDFLKRFTRSIGEIPMVMKKEKSGYCYNTMLGGLTLAALSLVIGGYADFEDVDRAYMLVTGQAAGPFGVADAIGLDVLYDAAHGPDPEELLPPPCQVVG